MTLTLGVDLDSYAIHVCALPADGGPPVVVTKTIRRRGDDEHRAFTHVSLALGAAIEAVRQERRTPGETVTDVWIERGYGASRKADFVLGAIYGSLFVATGTVLPGSAARPMLASTWKRDLTGEMGITTKTGGRGNGNVKKEIANDCARQLWEQLWPLAIMPTDPNQLDAFAIAWAGSRL